MSGLVSYLKGQAAEAQVEGVYARKGAKTLARRWRGEFGELDLIVRDGEEVVFVEVKASRTIDRALESLSRRQITRILDSAATYVGTLSTGSLTNMRFDVAAMDATGRIEIVENALAA